MIRSQDVPADSPDTPRSNRAMTRAATAGTSFQTTSPIQIGQLPSYQLFQADLQLCPGGVIRYRCHDQSGRPVSSHLPHSSRRNHSGHTTRLLSSLFQATDGHNTGRQNLLRQVCTGTSGQFHASGHAHPTATFGDTSVMRILLKFQADLPPHSSKHRCTLLSPGVPNASFKPPPAPHAGTIRKS